MPFVTLILILAAIGLLVLLVAYICAQMVFAVHSTGRDEPKLPEGSQYRPLREKIAALIAEAEAMPYEDVYVDSFDGLRLHGKLYRVDPKAPTHILFHGYRSSALLDFSGGLLDVVKRGHNAILVDQRAHAKSQGKYLSFGILERRDCLAWIDYASELSGQGPIVIEGVSMGAATVMMASELELPENVIGILADAGYSSPEKIIRYVMGKRHYPQLLFPFIRLGGLIFAKFDICSATPAEALKSCRIPVYFIHGDDDRFVPYEMGQENYAACSAKKFFFTGKGAGHAISYLVDREGYRQVHSQFMEEIL